MPESAPQDHLTVLQNLQSRPPSDGITPRRRRLIWYGVGFALLGIMAILYLGHRRTAADLQELVEATAHRHRLDPKLVAAVVEAESGGNARAVSSARAYGLMQLLVPTASEMARRPVTADELFNPRLNLELGCRYLKKLLNDYAGDLKLALMAYNAGPGNVRRWLRAESDPDKILAEHAYGQTRAYVRKVLRLAR